jgi:hypothetical protein
MGRVNATAVVTVTVEISNLGNWDDSCSAAQLHEQCSREAMLALNNLFTSTTDRKFRIIGQPHSRTVYTERKE